MTEIRDDPVSPLRSPKRFNPPFVHLPPIGGTTTGVAQDLEGRLKGSDVQFAAAQLRDQQGRLRARV